MCHGVPHLIYVVYGLAALGACVLLGAVVVALIWREDRALTERFQPDPWHLG